MHAAAVTVMMAIAAATSSTGDTGTEPVLAHHSRDGLLGSARERKNNAILVTGRQSDCTGRSKIMVRTTASVGGNMSGKANSGVGTVLAENYLTDVSGAGGDRPTRMYIIYITF